MIFILMALFLNASSVQALEEASSVCVTKMIQINVNITKNDATRLCSENADLALCTTRTNNRNSSSLDLPTSERLCRKKIASQVEKLVRSSMEMTVIDIERLVEEDINLAECTVDTNKDSHGELDISVSERLCRKGISQCVIEKIWSNMELSVDDAIAEATKEGCYKSDGRTVGGTAGGTVVIQ